MSLQITPLQSICLWTVFLHDYWSFHLQHYPFETFWKLGECSLVYSDNFLEWYMIYVSLTSRFLTTKLFADAEFHWISTFAFVSQICLYRSVTYSAARAVCFGKTGQADQLSFWVFRTPNLAVLANSVSFIWKSYVDCIAAFYILETAAIETFTLAVMEHFAQTI